MQMKLKWEQNSGSDFIPENAHYTVCTSMHVLEFVRTHGIISKFCQQGLEKSNDYRPRVHDVIRMLRRIKAWDMQFCVKYGDTKLTVSGKSLRYVYQTWFIDCWYLNLIYDQIGYHSNQSCGRGEPKTAYDIYKQKLHIPEQKMTFSPNFIRML